MNNGAFSSTPSKGSLKSGTYSIVARDGNMCRSNPVEATLQDPTSILHFLIIKEEILIQFIFYWLFYY